jgi:hypothetical protein
MAKQCTQCGAAMAETARFCGVCGAASTCAASATAAISAPPPAAAEDDSWLALAGAAIDPAPAVPVADPTLSADEQSGPVPTAAANAGAGPQIARGMDGLPPVPPSALPLGAPPAAATELAPPPLPPRERRAGRALWIVAIVFGLFAAALIVAWTVSWTRGPSFATVATSTDDPATPDEEWRTAYADQFLGDAPVTMITNASANVRDFPTTTGSEVLRSVAESSEISGRWVRGRDPATRWLKLADGGYIWDGNLAERGGANSPIRIPFSNADYSFGPDIEPYMRVAVEQSTARSEAVGGLPEKERAAAYAELEGQSFYARVPNRRWRGLTVTAVAQHYEAGSIYFRDDVATTRRAFAAAGVRFDEEGIVDPDNNELLFCSIGPVRAQDRQYGASALTCGS